ncbi:MAG: helix-turn-helix transcriptional regulator [Planctomycetaceae bacterium]
MSGLPPLQRQWSILRTLSARRFGVTLKELAEEHGVSQKTILRDFNTLHCAGFRLTQHEEAHGRKRWTAELDPAAPPLAFNVSELLALWVSRSFLQPLAGTLFWDALQTALRKIRSTLNESSLAYVDLLTGVLHQTAFRTSRYHEQAKLIDDLMVAIEDRRITFITYQSARSTEPLTYDVYPYGLIHHRGSLYLIAWSCQHDEVRTFKVDRLTDVALETLKFDKPPDFDPQIYLQHTLGVFHDDGPPQRVVIRFAPDVARYIEEHHWHHSQKLTPLPDGSLRAEFHLAALEELKSWALSFGAKAVVEEPEELRKVIQAEVARLLQNYQPDVQDAADITISRKPRAARGGDRSST